MVAVSIPLNSGTGDPFRSPIEEQAVPSIIAVTSELCSEAVMSYALFEDDEKLTRSFQTQQEVWNAAERAGLIVPGPDGKMALEDHFEIKPCEPDPDEVPIDPDSDFIFT
jgi:hypothetical protein